LAGSQPTASELFDLLWESLVDIGLPGITGYEVAQRLRAESVTAKALLIAVSGYGCDEDALQARAAGFDHYLVKPIDPGALQSLLARVRGTTSQSS
jgi:CheY-like chemotaxis protein